MPNRRRFLAFAFVATATAAPAFSTPAWALGILVDVELVDRTRGETLPIWWSRGDSWVAGRPGDRYAVRLRNRSGERVLVVLSIDGVNAVSGETTATGQTGYVLAPFQTTEITGWRKSFTEAAAFYFTALPDSYAARTDRPDNVGVIGAAVFREKPRAGALPQTLPPPIVRRGADRESLADNAGNAESAKRSAPSAAVAAQRGTPAPDSMADGAARDERLGTGHGEREYAPTTQTTFDRAGDRPNELVRIRYDSHDNLVALGVIRPRRAPPVTPDPFPSRFVPDPNG